MSKIQKQMSPKRMYSCLMANDVMRPGDLSGLYISTHTSILPMALASFQKHKIHTQKQTILKIKTGMHGWSWWSRDSTANTKFTCLQTTLKTALNTLEYFYFKSISSSRYTLLFSTNSRRERPNSNWSNGTDLRVHPPSQCNAAVEILLPWSTSPACPWPLLHIATAPFFFHFSYFQSRGKEKR